MYRGHSRGAGQSRSKFRTPADDSVRRSVTSQEWILAGVRHG